MGFLSRFEGKMEDTFEGTADKMFDAPISPVQIAKKAEKQMKREKMVGAGKQYAPTLYTVLVNPDDDRRLFGYYPTLAGETETYLAAKASEQGLVMDGQPLVRFIVDDGLKHGKFDIIAEAVAAPIIAQLRDEEMQRYGLATPRGAGYAAPFQGRPAPAPYPQQYNNPAPAPAYDDYNQGYDEYAPAQPDTYDAYGAQNQNNQQMPYVSVDEIDRPMDYGEYSFSARNGGEQHNAGVSPAAAAGAGAGYGAAAGAAAGYGAAAAGLGADAGYAAAAGAAAAGYGAAAAAAPSAGHQAAQPMAANTVVFAGGAQAAAPAPARSAVRARLIDETNNRSYDLASSRLLIGRESQNNIAVHDINASRTHAELRLEPQGFWILSDLGSTNGTFVNGREITSQPLSEGDHITIGMTNFVFTQA